MVKVQHRIQPSIFLGLVIAAIALLLYLNTLNHDYVLDDITIISQNHLVKKGIKGIPELLKTSYWYGYNGSTDLGYRPLSLVMFAIEWQLSPHNPHLNHLINILLYAATGFLLYTVLTLLLAKPQKGSVPFWGSMAFITALIFISHPVHTEVVANIKSRDEILSFFFSLLSIYFLIKYFRSSKTKRSTFFLSLFSFFLALISKENSITILAIVPLVIYFFTEIPLKRNIRITAAFVTVIIAYIALRLALPEGFTFRKGIPVPDNTLAAAPDFFTRMATAVNILGRYLLLLLLPYPLICDYSYHHIPIVNWSNPGTIASLIIYLALILYSVLEKKKKNLLAFGILFFLITFSIVSNIFFLVGATLAERFLYMPSLGFCLVVAAVITGFKRAPETGQIKEWKNSNVVRYSFFAILFVLHSFKTIDRNSYWHDNLTLFSADIKSAPNSCKLNYYHSVSLLDKVNANPSMSVLDKELLINEAIAGLNKALSISHDFVEAYEELGYACFLKGDMATAIENYEKAWVAGSHNPNLYNNYGAACSEIRQFDKAIWLLQKALSMNSDYAAALNNIGRAYNGKGNYASAVPYLKRAIALNPHDVIAYKNIARSLANLKDYDAAISYLDKAAALAPSDYEIFLYMGLSYQYKGDAGNAKKYLDESKRLKRNVRK